ncbi:MAG: sulfurtransferase [Pseudomonadota bacterium]
MLRDELLCTPHELSGLIKTGRVSVLDCRFDLMDPQRGQTAYLDAHIPGAAYVHLDHELSAPVAPQTGRHPLPEPAVAAAMFESKGIRSGSPVVIYDDANNAIAARAWWMLRWLGHRHVRLLDGGFAAWRAQGFALEAGAAAIHAGEFTGSAAENRVATVDELEKGLRGALVDARAKVRFDGRSEPIDPVAGHIPGAHNLPLDLALDGNMRFLPKEQVARLWVDTVGDEADVTVMCGSGVTACHLIVSALLAGRAEPRLYAGSWSEWIRKIDRPIARN